MVNEQRQTLWSSSSENVTRIRRLASEASLGPKECARLRGGVVVVVAPDGIELISPILILFSSKIHNKVIVVIINKIKIQNEETRI